MRQLIHQESTLKLLQTYANVYLFTSDTPSAKDKKLEKRCADIVNSFYDNTFYAVMNDALNELKSDYLLGRNDVIIKPFLVDSGRLQALLEYHKKVVTKACKPEAVLSEWYVSATLLENPFETAVEDLQIMADFFGFELPETSVMAKLYYDSLKETNKMLKEMKK